MTTASPITSRNPRRNIAPSSTKSVAVTTNCGPKVPADLLRLPLISPDDPWIEQWLRDAGVDFAAASLRPAIRYDSQSSEGQAAMAGHGIAMLTPKLWQGEIATGRLVQPFAQVSELGISYWLVCQEHRRRLPKIARFREWLLAEIASGR